MTEEEDYYTTLEVARNADDEALRAAYRRLAWRYHPDIAGPEGLERMQAINVAYQTLIDPERRRVYDATMSAAAQEATPSGVTPQARASRRGLTNVVSGPFAKVFAFSDLDQVSVVASAFSLGGVLLALGQIDGRITVVSVRERVTARELRFDAGMRPGALQALRLSPQGGFLIASGFSLGTRVWSVADGRTLWNTGLNAPSGAMDAVVFDNPPYVRLATPDAPISLASDDPFRWAEEGRRATAVYGRPLTGAVSPAWLTPIRAVEDSSLGMLRETADENWRVNARALSLDGKRLLTFSTGRVASVGKAHTLRLWDLERRNLRGAYEPRALGRFSEPLGMLQGPLAVTPDLHWVAAVSVGRLVQLFDLRNRKQRPIEIGRVPVDARLALSADGAWLALARGRRLQVYATEMGDRRQEWEADSEITALTFSLEQEHPMLSIGMRSGLVELWALA